MGRQEVQGRQRGAGRADRRRHCDGATYVVAKVEQKDRQEKPPPPFTTSTLQQQASIRLRFTAKRTMKIAQQLYEGVDLGSEGSVALITYMRTDSTRISDDALTACRDHIKTTYGDRYLPDKPNRYAVRQGRPGGPRGDPADRPGLHAGEGRQVLCRSDQLRLYTLIYNRFVASQMTPAIFAVTNVEVEAAKGVFKAQGKILKFDGYRRVLPPGRQAGGRAAAAADGEADARPARSSTPTQHFTQPPPRYNEASLVKTLEKEGIGRPSTYATIISTIQERGYVELKERRFYATEIGMMVTDLLVEHFPKVMDLKFTSHMEEELDEIETKQVRAQRRAGRVLRAVLAGAEGRRDRRCSAERARRARSAASRWSSASARPASSSAAPAIPECKYIKTKRRGRRGRRAAEADRASRARSAASRCSSAWASAGRSWAAAATPSARRR